MGVCNCSMFCCTLIVNQCRSWSASFLTLHCLLQKLTDKDLHCQAVYAMSSVSLSLSHWYPGSGVVLDCINSWSLQPYLLYVHSSIAIILMGKRELIALLNLSSWCLVMVERLFLAVPQGCMQFVIVVFPDHTHLLFFWPQGYKTFFMLNSTEHEISTAHKN